MKRKGKGKKKEIKNTNAQIAVMVIVALLILYSYVFTSLETAEPIPSVKEPSLINPLNTIPQTTMPSEEKPSSIEPTHLIEPVTISEPKPTRFITGLTCEDGIITMTLSNYLKRIIKISDLTVHVNGLLNSNPDCKLEQLEPYQSTTCNDIGRIQFRSNVRVVIGYPTKYESEVVNCSTNKITGDIIFDIGRFLKRLFG